MLIPLWRALAWGAVVALGASALAVLALSRGEPVSAAWLVTAALCTYAVAYRFYARFLGQKLFALDADRATPSERLNDGRDFVPTNRWVVFGHHFAAIAGPGPLVGPTLAAQFGYLPGALWIIVGVVLGGAVQDLVILCASVRRDGRSLGQMAKDEIGPVAGVTALVAVLGILVVLMAVLSLVIVNALKASPWGVVTIGLTIPIALLMGIYLRWMRPGQVLEATAIGVALLVVALLTGQKVTESPFLAPLFTLRATTLAWLIMGYAFAASVLPVWLLLAPRDYLSAFVKVGVVLALAAGILILLPPLAMPPLTRFAAGGDGPVFAGTIFPFAFITIACGAISGFHALVSSGTTPKLLRRETDAPLVGYGGMLTESLVAVMALIAACVLTPGVYFAINAPVAALGATAASATDAIRGWGFTVTPAELTALAHQVGESSLLSRTGGAPSLAVGMARLFSGVLGGAAAMPLWYHFAIMFEALFILTTLDAGTRVGRFLLQDLGRHVWAPFGKTAWTPAIVASSALLVSMWGFFLYQGVTDPLGGINSLWPLFGISNQLLAAVALCVGTTVILKSGRGRYVWTTLLPLAWLVAVTMTAGMQKIFADDPHLGFLAHIRAVEDALARGSLPAGAATVTAARQLIVNDGIDAAAAAFFLVAVLVVIGASVIEWIQTLRGGTARPSSEVPFIARASVTGASGTVALAPRQQGRREGEASANASRESVLRCC
ncbi:MAG: carbon starvation protein CstA [Gemmatimonadaceae bacterium]